jgi:hypothetical protein
MYGNLARNLDSIFAEGHADMTISDREYEPPSQSQKRLTMDDIQDSTWRPRAIARLEELVQLKPNWDSYGGRPVTARIADVALGILESLMRDTTPSPSIVPTSSGHVQFEWHTEGIDLEVEVVSPILLRVSFEDKQTGDEWARDLNVDLTDLNNAISVLSQR